MSTVVNWEFDPLPRYYLFVGDSCAGEVIFDGFRSAPCNDFSREGEVWRAIADGELVGRYSGLKEAQDAVRNKVVNRGLAIVRSPITKSPSLLGRGFVSQKE